MRAEILIHFWEKKGLEMWMPGFWQETVRTSKEHKAVLQWAERNHKLPK
jgi:hypothetical protein